MTGDADIADLPPELQDKVYRPGRDGIVPDVEVEFDERSPATHIQGNWEMVAPEKEVDEQ